MKKNKCDQCEAEETLEQIGFNVQRTEHPDHGLAEAFEVIRQMASDTASYLLEVEGDDLGPVN